MLGKKVELIRYIVKWQENYGEETIDMEEKCVSEEHKNEVEQKLTTENIDFTTEAIDQTDNEWFNGLEFNSYDEALEVFNKGEQAYLQAKIVQELVDNLRLRSDIDYIAIMLGVEI
jgi:hypothetical protein